MTYFEKEDLEDEGKNYIPSFPQNAHLGKKDVGKYFKIQMNIFQLQMFRFSDEMSYYWKPCWLPQAARQR